MFARNRRIKKKAIDERGLIEKFDISAKVSVSLSSCEEEDSQNAINKSTEFSRRFGFILMQNPLIWSLDQLMD